MESIAGAGMDRAARARAEADVAMRKWAAEKGRPWPLEREAASTRPASFGKIVLAVVVGNLLTALLGAMVYQLLRMF